MKNKITFPYIKINLCVIKFGQSNQKNQKRYRLLFYYHKVRGECIRPITGTTYYYALLEYTEKGLAIKDLKS